MATMHLRNTIIIEGGGGGTIQPSPKFSILYDSWRRQRRSPLVLALNQKCPPAYITASNVFFNIRKYETDPNDTFKLRFENIY